MEPKQENTLPQKKGRSPWLRRLTVLALVGIVMMMIFGRIRPKNLGVQDGKLAACPTSPNCVSTQAEREEQRIAPLKQIGDLEAITLAARTAILAMPRTKIVTEDPTYCHVECTSKLCRYVDDLELWIDEKEKLIHARSASRVGHSDMGVNRKRVESLFQRLVEAGVAER